MKINVTYRYAFLQKLALIISLLFVALCISLLATPTTRDGAELPRQATVNEERTNYETKTKSKTEQPTRLWERQREVRQEIQQSPQSERTHANGIISNNSKRSQLGGDASLNTNHLITSSAASNVQPADAVADAQQLPRL